MRGDPAQAGPAPASVHRRVRRRLRQRAGGGEGTQRRRLGGRRREQLGRQRRGRIARRHRRGRRRERRRLRLGIDQGVALRRRQGLDPSQAFHPCAHQRVPAILGRRVPALPAADVEPVLGAGHGDVEEPAVFLLLSRAGLGTGFPRNRVLPVCPAGKEHALRRADAQVRPLLLQPDEGVPGEGLAHGIGEKDHRRLQPLGAVHGHDPHLVTALLEVARDLRASVLDPVQKTLERRRVRAAVGQRERQELLDRVPRFRAEAAEQRRPPAARAQHLAVELERRHRVRSAAVGDQRLMSARKMPSPLRGGGPASPTGSRRRARRRAGTAHPRRAR